MHDYPKTVGDPKEKPKVTVHVRIPKEHKLHKSTDLSKLKVGKPHHFGMHGKVIGVNDDEMGKGFEMEVDGMDHGKPEEKPGSMIDDMKRLKKERTFHGSNENEE